MAPPKIVAGVDLETIKPSQIARDLIAALQHEAQTQRMYAIAQIFIDKAISEYQSTYSSHSIKRG